MGARINQFRRKVAFGRFELTGYAKEEMEQDGFGILDIKSGVYNGRIVSVQRHGGRTKYVVAGRASDRRRIRLVCRLTRSGRLRVITAYAG